jgi:hypothetical protein
VHGRLRKGAFDTDRRNRLHGINAYIRILNEALLLYHKAMFLLLRQRATEGPFIISSMTSTPTYPPDFNAASFLIFDPRDLCIIRITAKR